jgi:hypothetical protein
VPGCGRPPGIRRWTVSENRDYRKQRVLHPSFRSAASPWPLVYSSPDATIPRRASVGANHDRGSKFAADSPLEGTGFEPSVPASEWRAQLRRQRRHGLLPRERRHRDSRLEFRAALLPLHAHFSCPLRTGQPWLTQLFKTPDPPRFSEARSGNARNFACAMQISPGQLKKRAGRKWASSALSRPRTISSATTAPRNGDIVTPLWVMAI